MNDASVSITNRIIPNKANDAINRSNSFVSQRNVFEHCQNKPVRLIVELS